MGRRLNTSTPTVIQTELVPLDENFTIEANGTLEQWYYENTSQYAPDRSITPLILSPKIMVADKDSQQSWDDAHVTKSIVAWSVMESNTWVDITSSSVLADYELSGNNLIVHKNVSYSQGVTIMCKLTYVDPRDNGIYITTQETVLLTCNRDANVVLPEVAITSPSARSFNPLVDGANTEYDFDAVVTNSPEVEMQSSDIATYEMDGSGTEEIISDANGIAPILDIRYPDSETQTNQEFAYRQTANGEKPDEVGAAFISKIKGNTVAWNQFLKENKLVDMGLPSGTLWASCNIDITREDGLAASPFQYECSFFSWGNIDGHNPISNSAFSYDWGGVNEQEPYYENQPYGSTPGNILTGNIAVGEDFDAARANLGALWRMPTNTEYGELFANIRYINADGTEVDTTKTDKRVTVNGIVGLYLESTINGARLFFSCSGFGYGRSWYFRGSYGNYWSSTWYSARNARNLLFYSGGVDPQNRSYRYYGFALRPVITKSALIGDGKSGHKYVLSSNNKNITDVTLIYGAGNEPSTVAQFEADYYKWFGKPLSYEEYDAGSLRPVLMQSVKTTGFNQLKEVWERGNIDTTSGSEIPSTSQLRSEYIKILPSTQYYCKAPSRYYFFYDSSKSYISNGAMTSSFTTPVNAAYIRILLPTTYGTTYNNDVCLNFFNPSKNGTYEPYEEHIASVPITSAKGKLLDANGSPVGNSVFVFPDGLKKAGNVQDEIFVEDGIVKAIKRVGSVDLGTVTWSKSSALTNCFYAGNLLPTNNSVLAKYNYEGTMANPRTTFENKDMVYCRQASSSREDAIWVKDTNYTEAADFKTAMNGVMLYYELETPQTYVLDPVQNPFIYKWFGIDANNNEVLAETLPWYVSGQDTSKLRVDAMWGEKINVVLRAMMPTGALSPSKAYAALTWRIPDVDTTVVSYNGSAVKSDTNSMTFGTIVNIKGKNIEDSVKAANLRFKWVYRKNITSQETVAGWSQGESDQITIQASNLRSVRAQDSTLTSTLVFPYVYCLGAWTTSQGTETGYSKPTTTKNGVTYYRIVD